MEAFVPGVTNNGLGFLDHYFEIAAILKLGADTFGVLLELGSVIRL